MNVGILHLWILVAIIVATGAFGGYLNYLHNFDTTGGETKDSSVRNKYIFLGIGSAILIPAFLKMIASDLIAHSDLYDNINYLIFAGFCLVAAIFSRRFITSIGDQILEAAKKAEITSLAAKKKSETTQMELNTTQERIEDVKLSVSLYNAENVVSNFNTIDPELQLMVLVDSFIEKTSLSDYSERLKMKADLGRAMGKIIVRHRLLKEELLEKHPKEGMYLALAYAVELMPESSGLNLLTKLSKVSSQLYTKYVIIIAFRTLACGGFINAG